MEKLWKCWVLLLCIQVFFPTQPFAQTKTQLKIIDSLKTCIQQPTLPDTAKVDDLNELAWLHRNFDYKSSLDYAKKAQQLAQKIEYPSGLATAYNRLGIVYKNKGKVELAIQNYSKAISILEADKKSSRFRLMGSCYLGLGDLYQKTDHFKKARKYNLKALKFLEKEGKKKMLLRTYNQLGILHYKLNDYKAALQYYRQNLYLREELGSIQNIQGVYSSMGLTYLKLAKEDSAQYFIKKSIKLSLQKNDFQTLVQAYNSQGVLLLKQKKYVQAIEYFNKTLQLSNKINDKFIRQDVLENLSNAYAKIEQYDNAFKYFDDYKSARDSLEANFRKAMDYKDNYEKEKHQRELLEKNQKIQNTELARLKEYSFRQTLANYFFGVGLLLSLIIVFAIIRNYQERRKVRQKQQCIDKLLNDQEFLALSKMLEGQEKERERVAQDLHDRLGGMLSVVKLQFTALSESVDWVKAEYEQRYDKAMDLLDETCNAIRKVSHDFSAKALRKFGLVSALTDLKANIEATQALTIYLVDTGFEKQRLPAKYEAQVYRMIQELLGNVLKHAAATEVDIQLYWKQEEASLHISVEDNGRGFDVVEVQQRQGLGLAGLKSRVKALLGTYSIDSSLGKGTTIMIDIPLPTALDEIEEIK